MRDKQASGLSEAVRDGRGMEAELANLQAPLQARANLGPLAVVACSKRPASNCSKSGRLPDYYRYLGGAGSQAEIFCGTAKKLLRQNSVSVQDGGETDKGAKVVSLNIAKSFGVS